MRNIVFLALRSCRATSSVGALLLAAWLPGCGSRGGAPDDAGGDAALTDAAVASDAASEDAAIAPDAAAPGTCPDDLTACGYRPLGLPLRDDLTSVTSTDEVTGRVLPLLIRAPRTGGPYPVVLFEHGGALREGGENDSGEWGALIASHGYVVVHVGHPTATSATAMVICTEGVSIADCTADPELVHTIARPLDVIAVLDDLPAIAAALTAAGGPAADTSRVGIAGWSAGTQAPVTLLGATRQLTTTTRFGRTDARPLVAVMMSPTGAGFHHFFRTATEHSWSALRGPTLMLTGVNDIKPDEPDLIGSIRREPFDFAPADGTHRLLYSLLPADVGAHGTYNLADRESSDPRLRRLSAALGSLALAFLDEHPKDDADAAAYLASDAPRLLAGEAEYLSR